MKKYVCFFLFLSQLFKGFKISRTERQSNAQLQRAADNKARYTLLREQAYQLGVLEFEDFKCERGFLDFVVIYACEGYRKTKNVASVANSDLAIIKLSQHWMQKLCKKNIEYTIQLHVDQNENDVKMYWAKNLAVDISVIKTIRKSNSGKLKGRNWRSEFGVISIRVNDTYFKSKIDAWIDILKNGWLQRAIG